MMKSFLNMLRFDPRESALSAFHSCLGLPCPRPWPSVLIFLLLPLFLSACEPTATIKGDVLDIKGQKLPGVSVTVPNGPAASTDALGQYTLRTGPASLHLDFHKTGYTSGWLELDVSGTTIVKADNIQLWPLPESKGVFLFQDYNYSALDRVEPKRYVDKNNRNIFGLMRAPQLATALTNPLLIAYKLPAYDVHAHRLQKVQASLPTAGSSGAAETVWAPAEEISVIATPIDEPERLLTDLRFEHALAPGDYAIHWGALQGFTTTETRAFLFHVGAPNEASVEAPAEEKPDEKSAEKGKDKAKDKGKDKEKSKGKEKKDAAEPGVAEY